MESNLTTFRVIYADTDAMGIVYHTNYIRWFELGRNELMRQMGIVYSDLENLGLHLPLTTVFCRYLQPARYDDLLTVETCFDYIKRASIRYSSKIWDENQRKLLVEGYTIHACTSNEGKIRRMPALITGLIEKYSIRKGE
ncbi:MAG: thioesterase family protein [Smithellaceae bacterium]|nr:thioesterase family protein [Smithellaceae bacterium]MDD3258053.1 thioesterase family protein [Smithellaceae bacterium]MDD3848088.1 thioesterase family protein [Smithellaceae bacterium]HOG13038.1 thioesterase family protein [Smithellaceae bacterium]HOQ71161.1 thioesterase family protein [Smithellaceae bacterium]